MPVTALKIVKGETVTRTKIMTLPGQESGVIIDAYACNEEFIPIGKPLQSTDTRDEELYHRELRKEAQKNGHFISEESSNSEWNPEL